MRLLPLLAVLAVFAAAPAQAQLLERGVSRDGAVLATRPAASSFMCRVACSIEGGCMGWNWVRAGEDGPQARCELLAGVTATQADSCCDSGMNGDPRAVTATAAGPALLGNQYAPRSQTPTGPPVELIGDPTGGIWQEAAEEEDEEETEEAEAEAEDSEGEDESEETMTAEEEDDARIAGMAQAEAPAVTTPSARIMSNAGPVTGSSAPRYSVQQEYEAAPINPNAPPPTGVPTPGGWTDS